MENTLTKEQKIILTGYTLKLHCNFDDFHQDVEKRLGRPILTHEIPSLEKEIKLAYEKDFLNLLHIIN